MGTLLNNASGFGLMLFTIGTLVTAYIAIWYQRLATTLQGRKLERRPLEHYPSISVVRPVRGADVGAEENFTASLDTGYPGDVETLFVFDSADDPGLPIAERVVAAHRQAGRSGKAKVVVAGAPPRGWTGKLNAMRVGMAHARGELIAFGDSDTRPSREVLPALVETLMRTPGAGSTFAPVLVDQEAKAGGDALYALMQNALYSPLAAERAGTSRQLPFIMGQLMVFKREALRDIGGVGAAKGQLVDDMYLGKRVAEVGYKNVMVQQPLHIATGGMTLKQFMPVYRRWMMFSKNGLPFSFTWRQWLQGGAYFVALISTVVALVSGHFAAAIMPATSLALIGVSLLSLNRLYGGAAMPLRLAWAPWVLYLLAPVIMVKNLFKKQVDWRGRIYQLDNAAALVEEADAAPALASATGAMHAFRHAA